MADHRRPLGKVIITQVQPSGLIYETGDGEIYDPTRRVEVVRLQITNGGVEGVTGQGERLLDIHHAHHPDSHNNGRNAVSIGFTSHYESMQARFGPHLEDGTAGENIIIQADQEFRLPDLSRQIEFQDPGAEISVSFEVLNFAAPCEEFSHFAANSQGKRLPAEELKSVLQFLGEGRRGFLLSLATGQERALIQPGQLVFAID